jgi:hypothetical protein
VASLAVQLVKGDDYQAAARAALQIIDGCEDAIREHEAERIKKHRELMLSLAPDVPYRTAVKRVTGEKRFDRAEEKFVRFAREILSDDEDPGGGQLLTAWKQKGFALQTVQELTVIFERWWRQAKKEARRKGAKTRHLTGQKRRSARHELTIHRHEQGSNMPRAKKKLSRAA